ncbi:MAG: TRAP transporter small permease [Desulfovibrio sp.]|nr:TRAP transporter small permease [Desulfovibrio sp.]
MKLLEVFNTKMNTIMCGVMFVTFTLMVIITFFQVIFRYLLEYPLAWSEEVARYLFVWATYTGASIAFYEGKHINVTLFTDTFKNARVRAGMSLVADAASLWFLILFAYKGFLLSNRILNLGQISSSLPWLYVGVVYVAIPIGCLFMALNVLAHAVRHFHSLTTGEGIQTANPDEI